MEKKTKTILMLLNVHHCTFCYI